MTNTPLIHFKRIAGTLNDLSYSPCGIGIAIFGRRATDDPQASSDMRTVNCAACLRWLREIGRLK